MCLTETATVLANRDGVARVRLGGTERSVQNLLVPDARPGDRVVVGMGLVLARAPDPGQPPIELNRHTPEAPR